MKKAPRRWIAIAAVAIVVLALAATALARPGGGESYSGGGGHGGGGGGGSSGGGGGGGGIGDIIDLIELIFWLVQMFIEHPILMFSLLGAGLAYVGYSAYKQRVNKDWDSGPPVTLKRAIDLADMRDVDPDFSPIVFEDFAYRLFSTAHRAQVSAESLATVAPYVSANARAQLEKREPKATPIKQVIVGAQRVFMADVPSGDSAKAPDARMRLHVEYEANIATAHDSYFVVERWQYARALGTQSKPPGSYKTFRCPNCGAPWQSNNTGTQTCASCGQVVDNGRFDWVVEDIQEASKDARPPTLTTEVPERGTDLPTYRHPDADLNLRALKGADPDAGYSAIESRVRLIFSELNPAWSKNNLAPVRGLVSDGLYDYLEYWVSAYREQGLRNILKDTKLAKTELAKVVRDRWYDSVTIRIWATGVDYVINEKTGQVVRGKKRRPRPYSEYWTLIRSASRKGPAVDSRACSNCGAPLEVTMAGECTHCGAHVSGGEFDWVLSKIEQDDSYRG